MMALAFTRTGPGVLYGVPDDAPRLYRMLVRPTREERARALALLKDDDPMSTGPTWNYRTFLRQTLVMPLNQSYEWIGWARPERVVQPRPEGPPERFLVFDVYCEWPPAVHSKVECEPPPPPLHGRSQAMGY